MDILDIDEALKDDSSIFLADKNHDDVSNILQQWKTNNQPPLYSQYNNEQEFEAAAKDALHSSYDDATRTLNLSRFHAKPELGVHFCPLYVDKFLVGVLRLISKETPQVSKIVLSDNYLCSLKAFSEIPNGLLAGLDCLDISSNKIGDLRDLQYLANLKLKSLIVQGNGVANLKNDILAILPQLQNLQGCRQSQNKENVSMGRPKLKLFGSAVPENFVNTFIKDFYQFFDHPDQRSQLEQRYHELATFSLSVPDTMKHVLAYRLYNRNCKTPQSAFARSAKLQVGPKAVVHALGRLPKMETYLQGVNVDGQMSTAHVRIFTITGRFMEYSSTGRDLRNFQRSFVLELQESSSVWVIKNDMLCIIPLIEGKSVERNIKALSESQVDSGLEMAAQMEKMNIKMATPPLISTIPKSLREETILKKIKAVPPILPIPPPELNEFENMPRLILRGARSHSNDQLPDKNDVSDLEKEIDDTLLTDDSDELIINEDVLFAESYKHNSKTFTRPKRRNLDFVQNASSINESGPGTGAVSGTPTMLQLEIGGLVTTNMHKSFLQDTSPPSSICSSMNTERMNNSLITSADFSNLNFLQSTISLQQELSLTTTLINQTDNGINGGLVNGGGGAGYTLSDMIRDRKALESLTMCEEDGTLIKDSHIGQTDEISLTLSKTASGCSTMDNSTESMSNPLATDRTILMPAVPAVYAPALSVVLGEEMIGDTTFNLVDSLTTCTPMLQSESESLSVDGNTTFKRVAATPASTSVTASSDETQILAGRQMNTTFTDGCNTPEGRCETPENIDRKLASLTMESSTPLTTSIRSHYYHNNNNNNNNKQGYTPTLKGRGGMVDVDMNLSPIVGHTPQKGAGAGGRLNNTFETVAKAAVPFDGEKFVLDTMEILEQIEQPLDGTYSLQMSEQHRQMQCVMDLAEAEVEMLAQQGDEEQFEHMLAELGKSHSSNSSSSAGERLLSRRSRLYDDVNLSGMHGSNGSSASCNSASFIVQRREMPQEEQAAPDTVPKPEEEEQQQQTSYKLAERRERDRDRFKTIKITKEMRMRDDSQQEIIVPCIDDDPQQQLAEEQTEGEDLPTQRQGSEPGRLSRRDQNPSVYYNNSNKAESSSSNYLTYKKPKEKSLLNRRQVPQEAQIAEKSSTASTLPQPRSLSRPRYISGLQKFSMVSKATSAGAGLNATPAAAAPTTVTATATSSGELKSPMGTKSKSFHNLSSTMSGIGAPRPSLGGGLRRPGQQPSKLMGGLRGPVQAQEDEAAVFKVPKLVSGLRGPPLAGAKRTVGNGLARPSSGYYSLSVKTAPEAETPESLSSASSRGSLYGYKDNSKSAAASNGGNVPQPNSSHMFDTQVLSSKLTQVTTGGTGIPKPSGLRPPSQMKRSGLPRPSSIVRR
ncbi:GL15718 [Drosophila persimilis]|uniref:GL15718 n=1 Tax=Drosophila persimilis TaxID=7234 RepID=B4H8Z7_DROPE|nr:GL15718 [Drosophila persimilis]